MLGTLDSSNDPVSTAIAASPVTSSKTKPSSVTAGPNLSLASANAASLAAPDASPNALLNNDRKLILPEKSADGVIPNLENSANANLISFDIFVNHSEGLLVRFSWFASSTPSHISTA